LEWPYSGDVTKLLNYDGGAGGQGMNDSPKNYREWKMCQKDERREKPWLYLVKEKVDPSYYKL
jgi:hypothetical protein